MGHCYTHDIRYEWNRACPECRAEEAARERRRMVELQEEAHVDSLLRDRKLEELHEQEVYKRQNPGDYECPGCLYITLKRGASRCPACHYEVSRDHWVPIYECEKREAAERADRERLAAEEKQRQKTLAAEEWRKGEPERRRQAEVTAKAAAKAAVEAMYFLATFRRAEKANHDYKPREMIIAYLQLPAAAVRSIVALPGRIRRAFQTKIED